MSVSDVSFDSLPIMEIRPTWVVVRDLIVSTIPLIATIGLYIRDVSLVGVHSGVWGSVLVIISMLSISKVVSTDVKKIDDEIDQETISNRWVLYTVGIPFIGLVVYIRNRVAVLRTARKKRFHSLCEQYEDQLLTLLTPMQPYFNLESYLTGHDHETFVSRLEKLEAQLQDLRTSVQATKGIYTANSEIRGFERALAEASQLLADRDGYNDQFVKVELNRRQSFFNNVGQDDTSLDQKQREAVVRNDSHNRVIAGAGTGKTLVLTTRVAYLVKYQDVDPTDILVVTFLNEAAEEMQLRLSDEFGITGIEASTIHSFGYSIIAKATDDTPSVFDDNDTAHLIDDVIEQRRELVPAKFYDHFSNFLFYSNLPTTEETDFETKEEFVAHLRTQEYETLRGETVKSRAEKFIADFLYIHQVEYKYEYQFDLIRSQSSDKESDTDAASIESTKTDATLATTKTNNSENKKIDDYRPDFYLPEADAWIEHFGIDEDGSVAEWFAQSDEEYIDKIYWAREAFHRSDDTLIETYQFEFDVGRLRQVLTHRLTHYDVSLDRRPHEELVNKTYEIHERNIPIRQTFARYIRLARTFHIDISDIPDRLSSDRPAQYYFGMCGGLLLDAYEKELRESGQIDFTDMIDEAQEALDSGMGTVTPKYEHVMVDEFQDVSRNQLQFITELSKSDNTRLFAVGDDWQSIYSFQGAVVDQFIDFDDRFQYTETTTLDTNYRSPSQLVKASTELIDQNENQLSKHITAESDAPAAVVKHLLGGYREYDYVTYTAELVAHLVADYIDSGCAPNDIMVLCRYDDSVSHLDAVRKRLQDRSIPYTSGGSTEQRDGVAVCSVHQAKGREADHVIVTHASEDGMGFPATDRESELIEPVQEVEMNTLAEERRLFYVAITRSARTLDVITKPNQDNQSRFIQEISQYVDTATDASRVGALDPKKNYSTIQAQVAHLWDDTHPTKHQGGILEDHTGSVRFVSWANTEPPTVDPSKWYQFENINVDEYKGEPQVVIRGFTELTEIDPEDARVDVETIHHHITSNSRSTDTNSD